MNLWKHWIACGTSRTLQAKCSEGQRMANPIDFYLAFRGVCNGIVEAFAI